VKHLTTLVFLLLVSCGGARQPGPQPAAEPESTDDDSTAADRMREHFEDVADARDAVIQGDLEGVRAPMLRIAAAQYGQDLPWDWREWIVQMQESAGAYADTADILAAANAVAMLTGSCADCHRTTLGGPAVPPAQRPDHENDLRGRMADHAWGTEQLWLGLTAPSHEAWVRGADAIIGDPMAPEGEDIDEAMAPHLADIRALGVRAQDVGQPAEKTAVYAELIARCALCHSGLDGRR
jgi:mono/diheme cytochrome c family protein